MAHGPAIRASGLSCAKVAEPADDPALSEVHCFSRLEGQDVWSATAEDIIVDTVHELLNSR